MTNADALDAASLQDALAGTSPDLAAAFDLLSDETRLHIIQALFEHRREHPDQPAVPFSRLRSRAGVDDAGQFNYHLGRLRDRFVAKTDDGYTLTPAGEAVGALLVDSTVESPA
ncbi:hypothetical protein ACFQH6_05385 [Halobacteriaceae archaeon GCM10025711]